MLIFFFFFFFFDSKKKATKVIIADHKFNCAERGKYTLEGKNALEKLCEKRKLKYDEKLNSASGQVTHNEKRKKHTNQHLGKDTLPKLLDNSMRI